METARRILALIENELRLQRFRLVVQQLLMPLTLILFVKESMAAALRFDPLTRGTTASGADQAVPGMVVMFLFLLVNYVGMAFFREHDWHTWDRLRASRASMLEIVGTKLFGGFLVGAGQLAVLLTLGWALLGMHVRGSRLALGVLVFSLLIAVLGLGLLLVATLRGFQTILIAGNLAAMVLAGVGGSLQPLGLLPDWARTVAPFTPHYWAMRGFRSVLISGGGLNSVTTSVMVLLAIAIAAFAVAAYRLSRGETRLEIG